MVREIGSQRDSLRAAIGLLAALAIAPVTIAEERKDPVDLGLHESVRVRMAVIDLVVLDRAGRTVPGLSAADFEVTAHGRDVPVASLDVSCPGGGAADPTAAFRAKDRRHDAAPEAPRTIRSWSSHSPGAFVWNSRSMPTGNGR